MIRRGMSRPLLLALTVAAAACSKQHPGGGGAGLPILRRVPADTPYVLASLEPLPRAYYEKSLADARAQLGGSMAKLRAALPADAGPATRFGLALLEEIGGDLTVAGMEKNGFRTDARAVIYGLGFLPAFRLEVHDGAAIEALLAR